MGGILSGCNGYRGGKRSVEHLPVARLTYANTFRLGHRETYVRIEHDGLGVVVHGTRVWPVQIDQHKLHFGGYRRWLVCPTCESRREALYVDGLSVACRVCLNLRYASQHENVRDRMFRRANAIRKHLGWGPGIANPLGDKPKGMHWQTYQRLMDEQEQLADALTINVGKWIDRAEKRLNRR